MSRKFLDDGVEYKLVLNNGVGFDHLPGQANTYFDPGHMAVDPISGKRFVNEGPSDRSCALFVNGQYNALILHEKFELLPQTSASFAAGVNTSFLVAGTNAVDGSATFAPAGGVTLTTAGASGDSVILSKQTAGKSIWNAVSFDITNQLVFEAQIVTGANITATTIHAGLKLTNTDVIATDNDQTYFRYQDTQNGGRFQTCDSNNNVDTVGDSGVAVAVSTPYLLQIKVGTDRKPRYYINGLPVGVGAALRTGQTLLPFFGVKAGAAAAKAVTVRHARVVIPRSPVA